MPAMKECHKLARVKVYPKVCADTKHPLHNKVGRETKIRLKRGTDWMTRAVLTIECGFTIEAIRRGETSVRLADTVEDSVRTNLTTSSM